MENTTDSQRALSASDLFVPLATIPAHLQKALDRCTGCDGRGYMIVMLGGPGRRTQCDRCLRFRKREGLPIWTNDQMQTTPDSKPK